MKQNPFFIYRTFGETEYLLPYGQAISDHMRNAQINSVGRFIWDCLGTDRTAEDVIALCEAEYGVEPEERAEFAEDVKAFLNMLTSCGAVLPAASPLTFDTPAAAAPPCLTYLEPQEHFSVQIAGIVLSLHGPAALYGEYFDAFRCAENLPGELTVWITSDAPVCPGDSTPLLINPEVSVSELSSGFFIRFGCNAFVKALLLSGDGREAIYYVDCPNFAEAAFEMFHALRLSFLYLAEQKGMAAIHSASLLYKGKAYLFSGHSGMGKSTHTNMWTQYVGTPILNGDLNLVCAKQGILTVEGIPWCGTSGMYTTESYPLGGIVLLSRGQDNYVAELSEGQKIIGVSQRMISPSWKLPQYETLLDLSKKIASGALVCSLYCTKDPEAVTVIKTKIDAAD